VDELVDPNLLAPPPPRVKPKATSVSVVCQLCGTRIDVGLDKIGQEVKCPDCHTRNVVAAPKEVVKPGKPAGPTLEGTEDYAMSEVVDRPRYRPLQAARGEYEVLSAMDPAAVEHRLTVPGERARGTGVRGRESGVRGQKSEEDESGEMTLAPPVERAEAARDPRTVLPKPELEPENELYDGRYDDGLIGDMVDPRSPDAWKKAPFVYGIVEFLFRGGTPLRVFFFALMLAAVALLVRLNLTYARGNGQEQVLALLLLQIAIPAGAVWLFSFAAAAQAIVEATANGEVEVTNWPDWNVYEWFTDARFILVAALVSGLPGGLVAAATLAASTDDPMMAAFGVAAPPVLSWMVLFPLVLYSMLTEDSMFAVAAGQTLASLKNASGGWVYFYMYSILLVLLAAGAGAMMLADQTLVAALGAAAMVALLVVYARLVGRMFWYANQQAAKQA
jgi:DNA-directed RNA polymerase subunit RPC12/RpoP